MAFREGRGSRNSHPSLVLRTTTAEVEAAVACLLQSGTVRISKLSPIPVALTPACLSPVAVAAD